MMVTVKAYLNVAVLELIILSIDDIDGGIADTKVQYIRINHVETYIRKIYSERQLVYVGRNHKLIVTVLKSSQGYIPRLNNLAISSRTSSCSATSPRCPHADYMYTTVPPPPSNSSITAKFGISVFFRMHSRSSWRPELDVSGVDITVSSCSANDEDRLAESMRWSTRVRGWE